MTDEFIDQSDSTSPLKDPKFVAKLALVAAVVGVLIAVFVFPVLSPPSEGTERTVGSVTLTPADEGLGIYVEGVFPTDELYVYHNDSLFTTIDVSDATAKEYLLTNLVVGDEVTVTYTGIEGETKTIDSYQVTSDSPWV